MVKELSDELKLLQIAKGQLSTALRHQLTLAESIGKMPLPDGFTREKKMGYKQVGEVLFDGTIQAAFLCKKMEMLTNHLRGEMGLEEIDYSKSHANVILNEHMKSIQEAMKKGIVVNAA